MRLLYRIDFFSYFCTRNVKVRHFWSVKMLFLTVIQLISQLYKEKTTTNGKEKKRKYTQFSSRDSWF